MRSSKELSRALSPIVRDLRSARALPFAGTTTIFYTSCARSVPVRPLLFCWPHFLATRTAAAKKKWTRKGHRPASMVKKAICIALKYIDPGMVEIAIRLLFTVHRTSQRRVSCPSMRTRPLPLPAGGHRVCRPLLHAEESGTEL
jgi:hypothetical protein